MFCRACSDERFLEKVKNILVLALKLHAYPPIGLSSRREQAFNEPQAFNETAGLSQNLENADFVELTKYHCPH